MGKISDALNKAQHGTEKPDEEKSDKSVEMEESSAPIPESEPPQPEMVKEKPVEVAEHKEPVVEKHEKPVANNWDERLNIAVNEDFYIPEVFKSLRARILLPKEGKKVPKTIMVTSVAPKEGKSFASANLGVSLAQGMDQYSLLVNCDLRRPSLAALFGLGSDRGLVDYLRDFVDLSELIQKTSVSKLSILSSGKPPVNPAELLSSSRMKALIEELAQRYEDRFVIFDSPPFQLAAESLVLAELVDAVILVIRQGVAGRHQIKKLVEKIGQEKILGVVFNGHTTNIMERTLMKGYGSYSYQYTEY